MAGSINCILNWGFVFQLNEAVRKSYQSIINEEQIGFSAQMTK